MEVDQLQPQQPEPQENFNFERNDSLASSVNHPTQNVTTTASTKTTKTRFFCDQCCKSYSAKSKLNTHYRIHTGLGLHCCSWCGRKFTFAFALGQHVRVHTGERPFECAHCLARFRWRSQLAEHVCTDSTVKQPQAHDIGSSMCQDVLQDSTTKGGEPLTKEEQEVIVNLLMRDYLEQQKKKKNLDNQKAQPKCQQPLLGRDDVDCDCSVCRGK